MLADIFKQTQAASSLLERAEKAASKTRGLRGGDRVYCPLVVTAEFPQGAVNSQNLVFNVPADADFWAYRFMIYAACKVVDPVNGTPDDIVYRSTSLLGQSLADGVGRESKYSDFYNAVDGLFGFVYEGRELQNVDVPFSAAYTADVQKFVNSEWTGMSQRPGGMVFDVPMFLARGKTLTCRVTPTYLGTRSIEESITVGGTPTDIVRQHKYQIIAVLEGEKRVAAFR